MLDFIASNDLLSAIIAFALVLIPAIIIHEIGHFLAAKAAGITVLEFGLGIPPKVTRLFMWGETEFTLNLIPLGGFVRPLGEDLVGPVKEEKVKRDRDRLQEMYDEADEEAFAPDGERAELRARGVAKMKSVNEATPKQRIFFMAAGALANFVSAIVLFIIIALIGLPEVVGARVQVMNVPPESDFAQASVQVGDAIEQINGEYFASFRDLLDTFQASDGEVLTLTMLNTETGEHYEVTLMPDAETLTGYIFIIGIAEESPADEAGILPGDLIVAINGQPLTTEEDPTSDLRRASEEFVGQPMSVTLLRDGELLDAQFIPRADPPEGEGAIGVVIRSQFGLLDDVRLTEAPPVQEMIPQPVGTAVSYGFGRTLETFEVIASIPGRIIRGNLTPEEARPVSIIGISQVGGQFLQQSIRNQQPVIIMNFIALVSIFLGISNLLPLPALDGGRILFVVIEIIRGKPVSPEKEGKIHQIGILLLLGLGVLIMLYDLLNPFILPQ